MQSEPRPKPTGESPKGVGGLDAAGSSRPGDGALALAPELERKALRLALGLGLLYGLCGFAWILLSDALVIETWADPAWWGAAQRWKGLAFVAVTAILLGLLVRSGHRRLLHSAEQVIARESHLADLFSSHPQAMWLHDRHTLEFLDVNDAAIQRFGWSRAEFLRLTLVDIRPADEVPMLLRNVASMASGARDFGVMRHLGKSGDITHSHVTTHPMPYRGRQAVMVMAIDVTTSIRAQEALARQEERFRQLHQSLGEVLWLADASSRKMVYVSPAVEAVYGLPQAAFEAESGLWMERVHADDRATAEASVARLQADGHSECEYRIVRPDGSVRWLADRKKLIVDEHGSVGLVGGIAEDITAAKERDEVRAIHQSRLERMVAERTVELERVNHELDAFTRTAAHDLKSPLNAVAGFSQLLQIRHGSALGPAGLQMAAQIERSARSMEALVNDLLTLSRASTIELQLADTDLAELARQVVSDLRAQEPGREVEFEAPEQLLMRCEPGLARSLLGNLIGNAWKFTAHAACGRIVLRADHTDRGRVVTIEDNGTGFDVGDGQQLFKPFQRFHRAEQFGGTGIGLATCQRIVQRHGGALWIESSPGQGTRCHFTLAPEPAAQAVRSQTAQITESAAG